MSNRVFYAVLVLVIVGFGVSFAATKKPHKDVALVGVTDYKNQGENHISEGTKHVAYNSNLPSSGPHYADTSAPAQWGVYTQELPPEVFLHNEEHGGVVIAYKPDLPKAEIAKLQGLFAPPYSTDKRFSASKAILIPRASNKQPIEMASWTRTYSLASYDQAKIEQFYSENVSNKRAPEAFAGPRSRPINEAI